jgi:hypothetical protein
MAPQSATGGLWMTDANWKAALYLKSGLKTDPVTVTPVLYLSNGQRYPLSPVTLEPSGTAIVDIGQALQSVGIAPYATLCGYAEIEYQWPWAAVSATVKNVDVVNSLIFIFALQPSADWHPEDVDSMPATLPTSFEGLWWKQEGNVSGFLALSNVTGQEIHAAVRLTDQSDAQLASYEVTISPHGTQMLALDELETAVGNTGGVYLTHDGPERGLDINGGLEDKAAGYSAHLWMRPQPQPPSAAQPQSPQTLSFSELGIMTGAADPMMHFPSGTAFTPYSVVRNISNQPAAVTPELWWMSGGSPQSATLPQMTISPHQTMNLNAPALLAAAGLKNFNGSVNLILDTQAQAGGLVMSSGSVDQTNTYVFEVMPYGIAESAFKAMCYWSTGNGDDTMVTLWNPADEPQDLSFTLLYTGGQYVYPIHLGPRETRALNVSEILQSSIPDAAGNVIPAGIEQGSAEIAGSLGERQEILVSLDAAVYNVRKATCGYVCWECGGVVNADIILSPFGEPVGGTTAETFYETWSTGNQSTPSARWTSSSPSIATVNGSGVVTGNQVGSLTLSAVDEYYEVEAIDWYCTTEFTQCPTEYFGNEASGNVMPTISQSPPLWFFGTGVQTPGGFTLGATSATLTATGAGDGTYVWTVSSGSSKLAFQNGSTSITLQNTNTVTIYSLSYSTSSNDVAVRLQYTPSDGSQITLPLWTLTIDSPYQLVEGTLPQPTGVSACTGGFPSGSAGWYQIIPYALESRFGAIMSYTPVNESFGQRSNIYSGNNWSTPTPGPGTTNAAGAYQDNLCASGAGFTPPTMPPQNPIGSNLVFQLAQTWSAGTLTTGGGLAVQEDVMSYYQDHGTITQIASPAP